MGMIRRKLPRVLLLGGSRNQTTQMHAVYEHLQHECMCWFSPFSVSEGLKLPQSMGLLEGTIAGKRHRARCLQYLQDSELPVDVDGKDRAYDLVVTCSDLVLPQVTRQSRLVLVQEGMTDPPGLATKAVQSMKFLPRWIASTSATGISNAYDRFCVASEGYKQLFADRGADGSKLKVTGIPNFDNCAQWLDNDFEQRGYVLVCTSDLRETYRYEDRNKTILWAMRIAKGRPLIFKLHPNERLDRATKEIKRLVPTAQVFHEEPVEPLIANCSVLITQYSSVTHIGVALGKEVHSYFDLDEIRALLPIQNGGTSGRRIADVCMEVLAAPAGQRRAQQGHMRAA